MVEKINLLQKYVSLQYPSSTVSTIAQKRNVTKLSQYFFKPHPENWTGKMKMNISDGLSF